MYKFQLILILLFSLNAATSYAANTNSGTQNQYHSHTDIRKAVSQFVENNLQQPKNIQTKTTISTLDKRLKLTKCEIPLTAFTASDINQSRKFSVGVKCNGVKPWSLYLSVNIQKYAQVYISTMEKDKL